MRATITGLLSAVLVLGFAGNAGAYTKQRSHGYYDNSPSAVARRQRNARTFDPNQYYEHDLRKIPMGTRAWWDQYEREHGGDRR